MSVQAMTYVLEHSEASGNERLVLLSLANHAGRDDWTAYPSVPTMAREARCKDRTVQYALRSLVAAGRLEECGVSRYRTTVYRIVQSAPADRCRSCIPADSAPVQTTTAEGAIYDAQTVQTSAPKPSREPSTKPVVVERGRAFADLGLISEQADVASNALVLIAGFERGVVQVDEVRIRRVIEQVLPPADTDWDEVGRRVRDGIQAGRIKSQAPSGALAFVLKSLDGVPVIGQPQRPAASPRPLTADEQRRQRNEQRRARAAAAMNGQSAGLAAGLMSSTEVQR